MNKKIGILGIAVYGFLFFLAILFYVERTAFVDISFHLFYIILENDYAIQNNRFVSFFTQSFPLYGSRLGLELKSLMLLYSVSFLVLYSGVFAVLISILKEWKYGLTLLLLNTLMVSHTFYWIQSEFPQGLAFLILYFGLISYAIKNKEKIFDKILLLPSIVLLLFTLVFAHPLMLFPFTFISGYFFLDSKENRKIYLSSFLGFIGLFLIKSIFFNTKYDSGAMGSISNFITYFPNYFNLESNHRFLTYVVNDYYLLIAGFFFTSAYLFIKQHYLKLVLVVSFFIGYLLLINVVYAEGGEQFYIENLYLPLSIFVIIPFAFDVSKTWSSRMLLVTLFVVFIVRLIDISLASGIYTDRLDYMQSFLDKTEQLQPKKLLVNSNIETDEILLMNWGTQYEFWLLSTMNGGATRSIMISNDLSNVEKQISGKNNFLTPWGTFNYNTLSQKYFNFQDTSKYQIIEHIESLKVNN